MNRHGRPRRPAFTLLEVLTALAIFLFALIGIGQLLSHSADRALDAQQVGQATMLGQAKLAEVVCGAAPLSSQAETPCEEDSAYLWSLDCQAAPLPGLWNVQVRISRTAPGGN